MLGLDRARIGQARIPVGRRNLARLFACRAAAWPGGPAKPLCAIVKPEMLDATPNLCVLPRGEGEGSLEICEVWSRTVAGPRGHGGGSAPEPAPR
jgi:hypothetical protein